MNIPDELNEKQKIFGIEYLKDFNGTRAATAAGWAAHSAHVTASQQLKIPKVREYINNLIEENLDSTKSELRKRVLDEISSIAFDTGDPIKNSSGEIIGTRKTDKLKALELLGKYGTLFIDKQEIKHKIDAPISITIQGVEPEIRDSE
jgi:phage terminase small subunit